MLLPVKTAARQIGLLPEKLTASNSAMSFSRNISPKKQAMIDSVKKDGLSWSKIPEVVWTTITQRKKAEMSWFGWLTSVTPLIVAPTLVIGLTSRSLADATLKHHKKPNAILELLEKIYPPAYTLMMACGFLNGFAGYASLSRMASYFLLFLGSLYLWKQEGDRNKAMNDLASAYDDPTVTQAKKDELKHAEAKATAGIAAFARIFYCFAMSFTFLANSTQGYEKYKYEPCTAKTFSGVMEHFKNNWKANFKKEIGAGLDFTKKIFSASHWKKIGGIFAGDPTNPHEQKNVIAKGITNPFKKFLVRLGEPEVTGTTTMLNGLLRFISVTGTALAVSQLGGIEIFNDDDPELANAKIAKLEKQKPFMKWLYDATMILNNIGNAFMGVCSLSNGFNPVYQAAQGQLSAALQTGGAGLHMLSVACDTCSLYLFGQALKLASNACFQLANSFGASNKAVPALIANDALEI